MSFKLILPVLAISIYFSIFLSLDSDNNLIAVEAQQHTISDQEFHNYIEQMIGHLDASVENVQNNNNLLAVAHALHPIEEIVDQINERLNQTNATLTKEFSDKLNQYVSIVRSNNLTKTITDKTQLEKLLNDALDQSISFDTRSKCGYILNVTAELINVASEEYTEAMMDGKIINLLEYQDGQQFFNRAIILLEKSQALFSDNDKRYLTKVIEMKKDLDLKRDPSKIDMNVKEMLSEIKNSDNC
ncbi:MAG TPA: hypothetical protein VIQ04_03770 [Nitrososphaeraceae archaeon]